MTTQNISTIKKDRRFHLLTFLFFLLIYLLTSSGTFDVPDAIPPFRSAKAILESGKLDLEITEPMDLMMVGGEGSKNFINIYYRSKSGKIYSKYGILATFQMLPFVLIGKALYLLFGRFLDLGLIFFEKFAASWINCIPMALACLLLLKLARRIGFSYSTSLILSIILGLGTMSWHYAQTTFTEPLLTLELLAIVYFIFKAQQTKDEINVIYAALCAGAMIHTKVASCVVLPVTGLYLIYVALKVRKPKFIFLFFGITAIFFLLLLVLNEARFGGALETGYGKEITSLKKQRPSNAVLFKILRFTSSLDKGVFPYNPILIVAIFGFGRFFRRQRALCLAAIAIFLTYLIGVAWTKAALLESWGPRYLLVTIPFLVLPIGYLIEQKRKLLNIIIAFFFILSICLNLTSILVFHSEYQYLKYGFGHSLDMNPLMLPNDIYGTFTLLKNKVLHGQGIYSSAEFGIIKPGTVPATMTTYRYPMFKSFNLWHIYINVRTYDKVPWIIIIPCLMIIVISVLGIRIYRIAKRLDAEELLPVSA